jgi:hypothetical protein
MLAQPLMFGYSSPCVGAIQAVSGGCLSAIIPAHQTSGPSAFGFRLSSEHKLFPEIWKCILNLENLDSFGYNISEFWLPRIKNHYELRQIRVLRTPTEAPEPPSLKPLHRYFRSHKSTLEGITFHSYNPA